VDIPDGDLVRLARAGDRAAFRLLVERHQPMARARASSLCHDPDEVDDIVQESFLQALVALERLRDPDRFAGWLGGIVLNVCRTQRRRVRPALLADWPEPLHPISPEGLPSAEDLDRAEALRAAVADLPAGQRQAVELFYYADLPAGQIAGSAGAAKASLHKARRRLREYLTAHRPDLIPSRRTLMTTVRIAHAEPLPGHRRSGDFNFDQVLVVLADDAGHRALPIWLTDLDGDSLWRILDRPRTDAEIGALPEPASEALAHLVLRAVGVTVTAVHIDELGPQITAARIEIAGPAGPQRVMGRLGHGLALAAAAGAPVRAADAVMDRLAVPVPGDDLLGPFLTREESPASRRWRQRFEPRNLAFTDGLDRWEFGGSFQRAAQGGGLGQQNATGSHWGDYSCTAEDGSVVLCSAVPQPYGYAFLRQAIFADDHRGATVVFRGELRTEDVADQAALTLRIITDRSLRPGRDHSGTVAGDDHGVTVTGSQGWTRHEVTAQVPDNADVIQFGIALTGPGRVALRSPELTRAG
jgi:RNA polymerase sigma factor (sigma-70 family)